MEKKLHNNKYLSHIRVGSPKVVNTRVNKGTVNLCVHNSRAILSTETILKIH